MILSVLKDSNAKIPVELVSDALNVSNTVHPRPSIILHRPKQEFDFESLVHAVKSAHAELDHPGKHRSGIDRGKPEEDVHETGDSHIKFIESVLHEFDAKQFPSLVVKTEPRRGRSWSVNGYEFTQVRQWLSDRPVVVQKEEQSLNMTTSNAASAINLPLKVKACVPKIDHTRKIKVPTRETTKEVRVGSKDKQSCLDTVPLIVKLRVKGPIPRHVSLMNTTVVSAMAPSAVTSACIKKPIKRRHFQTRQDGTKQVEPFVNGPIEDRKVLDAPTSISDSVNSHPIDAMDHAKEENLKAHRTLAAVLEPLPEMVITATRADDSKSVKQPPRDAMAQAREEKLEAHRRLVALLEPLPEIVIAATWAEEQPNISWEAWMGGGASSAPKTWLQ